MKASAADYDVAVMPQTDLSRLSHHASRREPDRDRRAKLVRPIAHRPDDRRQLLFVSQRSLMPADLINRVMKWPGSGQAAQNVGDDEF